MVYGVWIHVSNVFWTMFIKKWAKPLASCNSPKLWIKELKRKWKPMLKLITCLSNKYGGVSQQAWLSMARAVAVGTLTYGAPVYDLNKTNIKHLQVLHRATLCTITGLPNTQQM